MDVVVFCYNRPDKLKLCLEAIDRSRLGTLWIFSDAAKRSAHADAVHETREVARAFPWERKRVVLRPHNFGTPANVIGALDDVFSEVDSCLILEDDCIVRPEAYGYVEWALGRFARDRTIFSVNTMAPLDGLAQRLACRLVASEVVACATVFAFWGWATWADRWWTHRTALEPFRNPYGSARRTPIRYGSHVRWTLESFERGEVGGWDARLMVLVGRAGQRHLHPMRSLMRNIGFDGTGVHFAPIESAATDTRTWAWTPMPTCQDWSQVPFASRSGVVDAICGLSSFGSYVRSRALASVPASLRSRLRRIVRSRLARTQY